VWKIYKIAFRNPRNCFFSVSVFINTEYIGNTKEIQRKYKGNTKGIYREYCKIGVRKMMERFSYFSKQ